MFLWIQDLLPKPDERPSFDDAKSILNRAIDEELIFLSSTKNIWTPAFCNRQLRRHQNFWRLTPLSTEYLYSPASSVYFTGYSRKTEALERYFNNHLRYITEQPVNKNSLAPSIFEYNTRTLSDQKERESEWNNHGLESGLNPIEYREQKKKNIRNKMAKYFREALAVKAQSNIDVQKKVEQTVDTKFSREMKSREKEVTIAPVESEEEIEQRRIAEREAALEDLQKIENQMNELEVKIQQFVNDIRQIQAQIESEDSKTSELSENYLNLKTVFDLLPDAKNNIEKLRKLADENSEWLKKLALEWEEHRKPLIEQYRSIRDKVFVKEEQAKLKLESIKTMRAKMKELIEDISAKDEKYKQLLDVYKQLPKDNRSNYTRRILEMVKNVKKQMVEIEKVLVDTKSLQKEINKLISVLNRSFAVTEEMIFQDAKKIPEASVMYKRLVMMNDSFDSLSEVVRKTGSTKNDILNLNEKILKIQTRTSALNYDTIQNDLNQVRDENRLLIEKIKKLRIKYLTEEEHIENSVESPL